LAPKHSIALFATWTKAPAMSASIRPSGTPKAAALLLALITASCAPNAATNGPSDGQIATGIVVEKQPHRMTVYQGPRALRRFRVALGHGGLGPKMQQGDGRVPEGQYVIAGRNPNSAFHLSLKISYPTPEQIKAAAARGVNPGGEVMIHGLPNGRGSLGHAHLASDWTDGCIAVTNPEIEWLWQTVPDGTPISIRP
jgi:murein L,D-transpeptidase YafK